MISPEFKDIAAKLHHSLKELYNDKKLPAAMKPGVFEMLNQADYLSDILQYMVRCFLPEDKSLQAKFVDAVARIARARGAEMRRDRHSPFDGIIRIQMPDSFVTLLEIKYHFRDSDLLVDIIGCRNYKAARFDGKQIDIIINSIEVCLQESISKGNTK